MILLGIRFLLYYFKLSADIDLQFHLNNFRLHFSPQLSSVNGSINLNCLEVYLAIYMFTLLLVVYKHVKL